MASVKDCRALAEAQPVEVTKANIPRVIRSQAEESKKRKLGDNLGSGDQVNSRDKLNPFRQTQRHTMLFRGTAGLKKKPARRANHLGEDIAQIWHHSEKVISLGDLILSHLTGIL